MKKGWQRKRLDEVCHFINGLWKGENPPYVQVGVIRNTNFRKDGTLDESNIAYIEVERKKFDNRRLQFGDIILEKSGGGPKQPVGRVALFEKQHGDFSFSNFTSAIRVRNAADLDFRFLHKFLFWVYQSGLTEGMQSHSTGIRNLDGDAYKAIKINFPPLPEQQRIVALLDEAFAGLATAQANAEKNLQNARALFESYLQSVFSQRGEGWVERTLGEVTEIQNGFAFKSSEYADSGFFVIRIGNVQDGAITLDNPRFIKLAEKKLERFVLNEGDILISLTGNIGRVGRIKKNHLPAVLNQRVARITQKGTKAYPDFLYYFLSSRAFREGLQEAGHGAAQQNVSTKDIETVPISLPDFNSQHQIASQIDALAAKTQRLAHLCRQKQAALTALKKSLLHQAFTGEI